jgi:hypothetical protein
MTTLYVIELKNIGSKGFIGPIFSERHVFLPRAEIADTLQIRPADLR